MKSVKIEELKHYAEALDWLAKNKSQVVFPNKDHNHAAIAIGKILKYTKKVFYLFDDDLRGDIVKNDQVVSFYDSAIDYISRGGIMKIVISDKSKNEDQTLVNFLSLLKEIFPKQIELKLASSDFKSTMKSIFNQKINFAIGDNEKLRLETFGEEPVIEKTRKAIVSFNDKSSVSRILEKFEAKYTNCEPYPL